MVTEGLRGTSRLPAQAPPFVRAVLWTWPARSLPTRRWDAMGVLLRERARGLAGSCLELEVSWAACEIALRHLYVLELPAIDILIASPHAADPHPTRETLIVRKKGRVRE